MDNIFDPDYFENAAMESSSDIILSIHDFYYMPKSEATKAYRGLILALMSDSSVAGLNVNLNPNSNYITKSDFGIWYDLSEFKEVIKIVNEVHRFRCKTANEFLSYFNAKMNARRIYRNNVRNAVIAGAALSAYYGSRH